MSTQTTLKTIDFGKVVPNLKQFIGTKHSPQEQLQYIYNDGQYLYATNGHILLRIKLNHIDNMPFNQGEYYSTKENEKVVPNESRINMNNLDRMIPKFHTLQVVVDNVSEFKKECEKITKLKVEAEEGKSNWHTLVKFTINFNECSLSQVLTKESTIVNNSLSNRHRDTININLSTQYLTNVLKAVSKLDKLSNEPLQINFTGNMSPIHFQKENVFDILVSPVRVY